MKNYFVILLLLAIYGCANIGRNAPGDTLRSQEQQFDSAFNAELHKNPEQAKHIADSLVNASTDSLQYYAALSCKALAHLMLNDDDSMLQTVGKVENFIGHARCDTTDALWRKIRFNILDAKGIYYSLKKEEASAAFYLEKAIGYSEHVQLPQAYMNLAECYVRQGNYVDAAENYRKALSANDSIGKVIRPDYIFNGLAMSYMQISDYAGAESYLQKSMAYIGEMDNLDRYILMNNFGNLYYYKGDYRKALPYFKKAVGYTRQMKNRSINAYVPVFNEAEIYVLLHNPDSAKICIDTLRRALKGQDVPMFDAHLRTLRFALALECGNMAEAGRLLREMGGDKLPFELQRIRNRYLQSYYEKTGDYRRAYALQSENRDLADSLKSLQVSTRVADIYMRYQQDTTLIAKQNKIQSQDNEIRRAQAMSMLWTSVALVFGLSAFSIYLIMRRKRDKMEARHIENIVRMRMENIRNCLSPHFTFNVLNHEISQYADDSPQRRQLMALSKILRRSVEVSSQMTVSLNEELDFVGNYINLECGAWKDDFEYHCHIDEEIDTSSFIIPSMFIQIPVENAIKHGLRAISGKKELSIAARKEPSGVRIVIVNNGTGYKPRLASSGTGKGMQVIYQTILLLNRKNTEKIEFKIGQNNAPGTVGIAGQEGTKVEIFIPSKFDYSWS